MMSNNHLLSVRRDELSGAGHRTFTAYYHNNERMMGLMPVVRAHGR